MQLPGSFELGFFPVTKASGAVPPIQRQIQAHLIWLQQLALLDEDLTPRIQATPLWREQEDLLRSVPGIGAVGESDAPWRTARVGQVDS
jgi:hypothetical protein